MLGQHRDGNCQRLIMWKGGLCLDRIQRSDRMRSVNGWTLGGKGLHWHWTLACLVRKKTFWPAIVSSEGPTFFLQGHHEPFTSVWQCRNKACKGVELHHLSVSFYSWTRRVVEGPHQLMIRPLPIPTSTSFPKNCSNYDRAIGHATVADDCTTRPSFEPMHTFALSQPIGYLCAECAQKHLIGCKCAI